MKLFPTSVLCIVAFAGTVRHHNGGLLVADRVLARIRSVISIWLWIVSQAGNASSRPNHASCPHSNLKQVSSLVQYKCGERITCTLSFQTIEWNGHMERIDLERGQDCTRVIPDTPQEDFYKEWCR